MEDRIGEILERKKNVTDQIFPLIFNVKEKEKGALKDQGIFCLNFLCNPLIDEHL